MMQHPKQDETHPPRLNYLTQLPRQNYRIITLKAKPIPPVNTLSM